MAYPRRQTVVIFAVCAVAVIAVALYKRNGQAAAVIPVNGELAVTTVTDATSSGIANVDSDWKKAFIQSGSSGASGSGSFKPSSQADKSTSDAPLTDVDQLGRNFMTQYANLRQAGLTTDPATVGDAMGQVAATSINGLPSPKVYALSDIRTVTDAPSAISSYGKDVNSIFAADLPSQDPTRNEAVLAEKALNDNDMSELQAIDPIIKGYQSMLNDLLIVPTPHSLAQDHLALINGVSVALYNAQSFRHLDTDPVRGMAAVSLEMVGLQAMSSAVTSIQDYFINAGVAFGS